MKNLQCKTLGALAVGCPVLARMRRAYPVFVWFLYNTHRSQVACVQQVDATSDESANSREL